MAYWMAVLAGIVESEHAPSTTRKQVVAGLFMYSDKDLCIVNQPNPHRYLNQIRFILGLQDCRVINQQTLEAARFLRANHQDVEWVSMGFVTE